MRKPPQSAYARSAHRYAVTAVSYFAVTNFVVVLGVSFGGAFIKSPQPSSAESGWLSAFMRNDGRWYRSIAKDGYSYTFGRRSNVAFFPAYPMVAKCIQQLTGIAIETSLLITSNLFLFATFPLLADYVRRRFRDGPPELDAWVLLALGTFPAGCFFRMAYSESMFIFLAVLVLYGVERGWHPAILAVVAGLGSGTRSVGIALAAVVAIRAARCNAGTSIRFVRGGVYGLAACWGLAGFIGYQALAFSEPLAFAKVQRHWKLRPEAAPIDKFTSLVTLGPIWDAYNPESPVFWEKIDPQPTPLFSLVFWNPILFISFCALVLAGAASGKLSREEVVFSAVVLVVPYLFRAHEMGMGSSARFAAVAFPVYFLHGVVLARSPMIVRCALLAMASFFMATFAALFVAGYPIF